MLTDFYLHLLFHAIHHVSHSLQYAAHCRVVLPRHWHPHKYGRWQYDGSVICRIWDRAGTMHPQGVLRAARRGV